MQNVCFFFSPLDDGDACLPAVRCPKCVTISTSNSDGAPNMWIRVFTFIWTELSASPRPPALAAECVNINFRYSFLHLFRLLTRVPIGKNGYVTSRSASRRIFHFIFRHQRNVFRWKGRRFCGSRANAVSLGHEHRAQAHTTEIQTDSIRIARRRCVQFNRVFCQFSLVLHFRLEPHTKKSKSIWLRLCGRERRLSKCMFNCVTGTFIKIIIIIIITPLGKGKAKN